MSDIDLIIERLECAATASPAAAAACSMPCSRSRAHFTVDDVLHVTRKVGRATVFRTMKLLLDLNIVCRVHPR